VVVDTTNYYPRRGGAFAELDRDGATSTELLARQLPGAPVVKAFNTVYWERLRDQGRPRSVTDRLAVPLAGDDAEAKRIVAGLIGELGFDPVDTGRLAAGGRLQQPGGAAYNVVLTGEQLRQRLGV
jgi:predicted dinucleotide-binding enzyme